MTIRLRQLRTFNAVMEFGTASAAGEHLGLTQSSISRTIDQLEWAIGFKLFHRRGRRLTPSPEGLQFYQRVEGALAAVDGVETIASDIRDKRGDRLSVCSMGPLVHGSLVAQATKRLLNDDPKLRFTVDMKPRIAVEEWVSGKQADLGLTLLPVIGNEVDYEEIITTAIVAVVAPDHPLGDKDVIRVEDLMSEKLILSNKHIRLRQMIEGRLLQANLSSNAICEASTSMMVCQFAAVGMGVGICDPFSAASHINRLHMVRLEPDVHLTYAAIWPKTRDLGATAKKLVEHLKTCADEFLDQNPAARPTTATTTKTK